MDQKNEGFYIKKDNINPDHYKTQCSLECIDAMLIIFGTEKVVDFCTLNAWKYIWRWENKNGEEDLDKAIWYIKQAKKLSSNTEIVDRMESYILSVKSKIYREESDG